jgi:Phosphotransferase enzyme family
LSRAGAGSAPEATVDASDRPLLRFVARSGALTESRAAAARAALVRSGGPAYAIWPDAEWPIQMVPVSRPDVAAWAWRTFEPSRRRPGPTAYLWSLLRAGAALSVDEPGPLVPFAEAALGRPAGSMDALFASMTGGRASKLLCFVFDPGAAAPSAVAKVIPDPRHAAGLAHEVRALEAVRARDLPPDVAAAIPAAPIATGTLGGDFVVVEPVDPLAPATGSDDRDAALGWLERFHRETTTDTRAWDEADTADLAARAGYAWERERPDLRSAVLDRVERAGAELHGTPVPRSASHGDFWRGNIAHRDGTLRVFDWEWAAAEAHPFLDLWTYELAPLVERRFDGTDELVGALEAASGNVEAGLAVRGLPPRFAAATLAPMLADLAFRVRRDRGIPGGSESRFARMLPAVERVIGVADAD